MMQFLAGLKSALTTIAGLGVGVGMALEAGGVGGGNEVAAASAAFLGYAAQDAHRAAQKEDLPATKN